MTQDTRCLLVDDHTLFSEALALLIAHRHPQVALRTAASLGQALQQLAQEEMQLVLLDLNLPDSRGVDTLRRLREAAPGVRSIVLSADDRAETVEAALEAGAAGFISKSADGDTLGGALRQVLAGGVYVPTALLDTPDLGDGLAAELPQLTPRQLDVFRGVVDGKSNKLIARELGLSDSTVKTHVQAIYERLGIGSRAQAVRVAARQGWLAKP